MLLVKLIIKKTVKIRMNLKELKERAKNLCNLDYWLFVLVYLVFSSIISIVSSSYGVPLLVVGGPLTAGFIMFNLNYIKITEKMG